MTKKAPTSNKEIGDSSVSTLTKRLDMTCRYKPMYLDEGYSLSPIVVETIANYEIRSGAICYVAIFWVEFDRCKLVVAKYRECKV